MKKTFLLSMVLASLGLGGASLAQQSANNAKAKQELRVDVNHAGAEELAKLPGVGEQVAKRIIAYREANGPFEKTEEIMNVRGIGEKTFLKLEPHIVLNGDKDKRKK
jgi:competence protein ComEA